MKKHYQVTSGSALRCRGWRQEALLRLLENVLAVGENPDELIVYAALGRAARNWASHDAIVETLKTMAEDETLLIQSGKPIGVVKTHANAPLVIMANCNMVGQWAKAEVFYDLQDKGLICWGGLTAGAWQYIGSQGVIQGTFEIFMQIARQHFHDSLAGKFILTAGLGGMGGSQPLAGVMAGAAILVIETDPARIAKRLENGYLQKEAATLDEALALIEAARASGEALSVGLCGNAADIYPELVARGITPDIVTDQTSAHDLVYGYIPAGMTLEAVRDWRKNRPQDLMAASLASIKKHVEAMLTLQQRGAVVFDNGNLIRTQAKSAVSPTPLTSRFSPKPSSARSFARRLALTAGWRFPTTRRTSPPSTPICWNASRTTPRFSAGFASRAPTSPLRDCPRASPGWDTKTAPPLRSRSMTWSPTAA